jgi:hypothetical protein
MPVMAVNSVVQLEDVGVSVRVMIREFFENFHCVRLWLLSTTMA